MMEYTLEEDIPEEFKGGTLTIREDDEKSLKEEPDHQKETPSWKDGFVPFTQKITETLKYKRSNSISGKLENAVQNVSNGPNLIAPTDFFTFREGIVDNAIRDCTGEIMEESDGKLCAKFLLTEINLWDSDKERLILVTEKCVFSVKYDFIALKMLEYRRIMLEELDSIVMGELVYPSGSLVPRLNGIADGLTTAMQTCLFAGWSKHKTKVIETFHPRDRKTQGIRLMWNKGQPLTFSTLWNPFRNDFPFCTLAAHPLYFHEECTETQRKLYDLNEFGNQLREVMKNLKTSDSIIHHNNIVLQNYVGLGSLIHNRNSLGFYKVRGKFSF